MPLNSLSVKHAKGHKIDREKKYNFVTSSFFLRREIPVSHINLLHQTSLGAFQRISSPMEKNTSHFQLPGRER